MKSKILMIPFILFVIIAATLFWQLQRNARGDEPSTLESTLIGKPIPDIQRQALFDSDTVYPATIFTAGKPVLLNIWATWCPTCEAEHQFLNTLKAQGIPLIGLNFRDDRTKAQRWLARGGDPYQYNLFDGNGMAGLDLGIYGAPETFLIDGKGIIRYRLAGELTGSLWKTVLKPQWDKLSKENAQ